MRRRLDRRSVRRAIAACAAMLTAFGFASSSAAADESTAKPGADGWYDGAPPDGSFHVRGPVAFQAFAQGDDQKPGVTTQGVRGSQPAAFDGVIKYIVSCTVDPSDRRPGQARIEDALVLWKQNVDFAYKKSIKAAGLSGIEFQLADPKKTLRVRLLPAADRMCTLVAQWNNFAPAREPDVQRFFDSFALAKR